MPELQDLISLAQARELIPGRPSIQTLHRWHSVGVDGRKLRSVKVGGRRFLSRDDIVKFIGVGSAAQEAAHAS